MWLRAQSTREVAGPEHNWGGRERTVRSMRRATLRWSFGTKRTTPSSSASPSSARSVRCTSSSTWSSGRRAEALAAARPRAAGRPPLLPPLPIGTSPSDGPAPPMPPGALCFFLLGGGSGGGASYLRNGDRGDPPQRALALALWCHGAPHGRETHVLTWCDVTQPIAQRPAIPRVRSSELPSRAVLLASSERRGDHMRDAEIEREFSHSSSSGGVT